MRIQWILVLWVAACLCSFAQTPSEVYDMPLPDVLKEVQQRYGIVLKYEDKNVKASQIVVSARWKYCAEDVEKTLDNILVPLDLRYVSKGNHVYEIKAYEYYRKPENEGVAHIAALQKKYGSLSTWEERKERVKENIFRKIGLSPLPVKTPLHSVFSNKRSYDGYTVENVSLEVLPGVYLCGSLYLPAKKGKYPAMLCPHGHFYNKVDKSIPNERGRYRADQQYRCAMLARMGVAVFSYDMFAWGESMLQVPLKEHRTGLALTMQVWNGMRVVDFLYSLDYIDRSRIGITGASGGGTQTFLVAALDDRITLSVPTVMVSCHFYGGCPCESGLPIHHLDNDMNTHNAEIAALFAPKSQLVISDGNDWTSNTPQVEFPYLQSVYSFYGKGSEVENVHLSKEGHDYGLSKRIAMYDFVARRFGLDMSKVKNKSGIFDESKVTVEPAENMYAFGKERKLPENAVKGVESVRLVLQSLQK